MSGFASGLSSQIPEVERQVNRARSIAEGLRVGGFKIPDGSHAKGLLWSPMTGILQSCTKGSGYLRQRSTGIPRYLSRGYAYKLSGGGSGLFQDARIYPGALGGARGNVTNKATLQFYGDKPSPAKTARAVEKTMRRMLYGH